jgi:hypothetical protein
MPAPKLQPTDPGTAIQIVSQTPPELAAQEATMRTAVEAFGDDQRAVTLLIGQRIGRRQVLSSLSKLVTVTDLEDLKRIKESRDYVGYQTRDDAGELVTVTSWAEYCTLVELRSRESVDLDLKSYEALGAECFNALRTLGIGPAKMRELRRAALPEADSAALIELAKAGDKDAVLDLAEDLIARHAEEKAAAARALDDARGDIEAKEKRGDDREREIESLNKQLRKARLEASRATPDETAAKLREKCQAAAFQCRADISYLGADADSLHNRFTQLRAHAADQGNLTAHDAYLGGLIGEVMAALRSLRDEIGLPIVGDHGDPNWSMGG